MFNSFSLFIVLLALSCVFFCVRVTVKQLTVETASEVTYLVGWACFYSFCHGNSSLLSCEIAVMWCRCLLLRSQLTWRSVPTLHQWWWLPMWFLILSLPCLRDEMHLFCCRPWALRCSVIRSRHWVGWFVLKTVTVFHRSGNSVAPTTTTHSHLSRRRQSLAASEEVRTVCASIVLCQPYTATPTLVNLPCFFSARTVQNSNQIFADERWWTCPYVRLMFCSGCCEVTAWAKCSQCVVAGCWMDILVASGIVTA